MKFVHLVGFITKKSVTMHGNMNVKRIDQNKCQVLLNICQNSDEMLNKLLSKTQL